MLFHQIQSVRRFIKRWTIEVFFKQTKQHLGLASELQVRGYTSCVAHSSIVFLRYMMLAYYKRQRRMTERFPACFTPPARSCKPLA